MLEHLNSSARMPRRVVILGAQGFVGRRARGCWRPKVCRYCRWGVPRPIFSPPGPQTGFPRNFGRTMPSW